MEIKTISELTADKLVRLMYEKGMKESNPVTLKDDTNYAVVLVELHPTVVVPDDYPTLKAGIEAVTGIPNISLLIDFKTRAAADLPSPVEPATKDTKTRMELRANLKFVDVLKP